MADVQELNINNTTYDIKAKSIVDTNSGAVKFWTGTRAAYDTLVSGGTTDANTVYVTDNGLFIGTTEVSNISSNRNIGEIVPSIVPLTDAGLHLLDGSLINGAGIYADFVSAIGDIYGGGNYPDLFETEANWQTAVTTYGVCGKFVYDSVGNTVRLPKITGIVEGTTDLTALGDLVQAGLPNITGRLNAYWNIFGASSGAFYPTTAQQSTTVYGSQTSVSQSWEGMGLDASRSSSIYGNSSTVQPQTIKVLYYIVMATTTKTEIEVDIDQIATDLNSKADIDLTNVNNSGTSLGAGWSMPSYTYTDLTLGATGSTYTAPANGYFVGYYMGNGNGFIRFQGSYCYANINNTSSQYVQVGMTLPVHKGTVMTCWYAGITSLNEFRFVYAQGSESEAN